MDSVQNVALGVNNPWGKAPSTVERKWAARTQQISNKQEDERVRRALEQAGKKALEAEETVKRAEAEVSQAEEKVRQAEAKAKRWEEESRRAEENIKRADERVRQVEEKVRCAEEKAKRGEEDARNAEEKAKASEREVRCAEEKIKQVEADVAKQRELITAREEEMEVKIQVEKRAICMQCDSSRSHLIDAAIQETIMAGVFGDIELRVNSRRTRSGSVHTALPVYARAVFVEAASPVLKDILASNMLHVLPRTSGDYLDEDSDMEEEKEDEEVVIHEKSPDPTVVGDDIDEAILDEMLEEIRAADMSTETASPPPTPTVTPAVPRVIQIGYGAAKTWQALIYYLYTGRVSFRNSNPQSVAKISCSPRSMYMLATKLSLDELKKLSEDAIISGLSAANIIKELFSDFTWRHPDILAREIEVFRGHAHNAEVCAELKMALKSVANGRFSRRGAMVLGVLFDALTAAPPVS